MTFKKIVTAISKIRSAAYEMRKDGEEFITLTFSDGNKKRICVTGDSGVAMARDVFNYF